MCIELANMVAVIMVTNLGVWRKQFAGDQIYVHDTKMEQTYHLN